MGLASLGLFREPEGSEPSQAQLPLPSSLAAFAGTAAPDMHESRGLAAAGSPVLSQGLLLGPR